MLPPDRLSDFRTALWKLTTEVIPQTLPILQPSLANIVRLLGEFLLDPEESDKIYFEIREIWEIDSLELDPRINLLALCAWKMRLYLIFNHTEYAFRLFRRIMHIVRTGDPSYEELKTISRPHSAEFPYPLIPDEDIELLNTVGCVVQELNDVSVRKIVNLSSLSQQEINSRLKTLEMVFGCMVAVEALGLYRLRAEIKVHSDETLSLLLKEFRPFAYRCELHSPNNKNIFPARLSVEFNYPVSHQGTLYKWGKSKNVQLYRQVEQSIYQNFNSLNRGQWYDQETTRLKRGLYESTLKYKQEEIPITKNLLRTIDACCQAVVFSSDQSTEIRDHIHPYYDLKEQLGLIEDWKRELAKKLFREGILVPYFFSKLLLWRPEYLIEGNEVNLYMEGIKFLYARQETLQLLKKSDETRDPTKFRLYVPKITPNLVQENKIWLVRRLYWTSPLLIRSNLYNFKGSCWKAPNLPSILEFL